MKSRLYLLVLFLSLFLIDNAYSQGTTCDASEPFCAGNATLTFPNTSGAGNAESGPNYGCLGSEPNPAWYFLQIDQPGTLNFNIVQNTQEDLSGTGLDVDFIAYGPFNSTNVCNAGQLTAANTVDCSYLPAFVENFTINNAQAGDIYVLLITNFSNQSGFIQLQQTNAGAGNAGSTDCSILNAVNSCEGQVVSLDATTPNAVRYEWEMDGMLIAETGPILNGVVAPSANYVSRAYDSSDTVILVVEFNVNFQISPSINATTATLEACDDDYDGIISDFMLTDMDLEILNGQTDITVSYYETSADAEMDPAIPGLTSPYSSMSTTLFVRLENDNTNCFTTTTLDLIVNPIPQIITPSDLVLCDDDYDGAASFILTDKDIEILNGQTDITVSYFNTLAEASADRPGVGIASPFISSSTSLFVRLEDDITNCFSITTLDLVVNLIPQILVPSALEVCDDDYDGVVNNFMLTDKDLEILNGQTDITVSYYETLVNAEMDPAIPGLTSPYSSMTTTLFVRLENNITDCVSTTTLDLLVNPLPTVVSSVILKQCDDDTDGISLFNLTEANELISTNALNETFTYYLTEAQAQSGLVADQISNFTTYANPTALNSEVYVRIESDKECFRTSRIDLIVGATQIPAAFNLSYSVCDDAQIDGNNRNGIAAFDFSDATAQIEALFPSGQNIDITYYTNLTDALAEDNAIADISNHRNITSPNVQGIFIRIDSEDVNACLGLGEHISLTVDALPDLNVISNYPLCSSSNDAVYDLTIKDSEVTGTQITDLIITYHESLNDAINNVDPIIGAYLNSQNPRTIYVRSQFDDNNNGIGDMDECFTTDMSFDLIINQNPVIFSPASIRICNDVIPTEYDLTLRYNEITGSDNNISLEYFESIADLNANTPILNPTQYNNIVLDNDIIILATGLNGCTSQTTLELKTILYANLNLLPSPIEECEIDNDGFDSFDITRQESSILNGLDPLDFTFSYYENQQDAIEGNTSQINNITTYTNTTAVSQTIYVRVLPNSNECFQVLPLTLIVNPVPEIAIKPRYVICLSSNDTVINPEDDTFLPNPPIDTQLNPTDYSFQWYLGEDVIAANLISGATQSTFSPTTPGFYTVNATRLSTGCTIPATTQVFSSYPPESIGVTVTSAPFSENNSLEVSVVGVGTYEFSLDFGVWQSDTTFNNVEGGTHTIRVRDPYNCKEFVYEITVIDYPKFFTPNSDGYNDTWNIYGISNQTDAKIYIFDRYGKLLKQLNPAGTGWDGTYSGEALSTGDYWFTVDYREPSNDIKKQFKSHFTLKR